MQTSIYLFYYPASKRMKQMKRSNQTESKIIKKRKTNRTEQNSIAAK